MGGMGGGWGAWGGGGGEQEGMGEVKVVQLIQTTITEQIRNHMTIPYK